MIKTLNSINVRGKRVLLRIDVNSEVIGNKVLENLRYKEHSKTIRKLLKKKAVVVILAHQSRLGKKNFVSLKQHAKILNKYVKVKFVDDVYGKKALKEIEKLKMGEALLLDNVRKLISEFDRSNNLLVKNLAKKFDFFVNDAFSVMHRNQNSVTSFPKLLPSAIGPNVENELKKIHKLKVNLKNSVFILGGEKASDVVLLVKKNKVLTTGTLSLLALQARGYELGREDIILKKDSRHIREIKKYLKIIKTPIDLAILYGGKRKEIDLDDLPVNSKILDIGSETIKNYVNEIRKAKAVFFKGAAGIVEDSRFQKGTKELLKAISSSKKLSVVAGGSSGLMIKKFKINKNSFSHLSLSGGALVHYLAGKKLPGLEVMR